MAAVAVKSDELKELDIQILAISTDSCFSHKIWQQEELSKMVPGGVPFPLLSDPRGRVGTLYGVFDEEAGINLRGRFLIDPDGVIQAIEILALPVGRNVSEMLRQVKAFMHARATGENIPSGWQPGKRALKPGPELVGKVWEFWKVEMASYLDQFM